MLTTDPFQVYKQDAKYSCDPFVMVLANYPAQLRWRHGFSITLGILPGDRDKAVKVRLLYICIHIRRGSEQLNAQRNADLGHVDRCTRQGRRRSSMHSRLIPIQPFIHLPTGMSDDDKRRVSVMMCLTFQ